MITSYATLTYAPGRQRPTTSSKEARNHTPRSACTFPLATSFDPNIVRAYPGLSGITEKNINNLMTKRQVAVLHALLVLVTIVALALVTTWALLAIGEGTAAINLREYGAEFTFGGTFALFIGLIGIFVKTFKNLLIWLTIVLLTVLLSTQFQQMSGKETKYDIRVIIESKVLFMALSFCGLAIVVWVVLRPWRWNSAKPPKVE